MDLTLDILTNKEKYADDRVIVLGDGEQITVKELRDKLQPRADFTKASEGWKSRERELQGEAERHRQAFEGAQAQLAEALREKPPVPQQPGTLTEQDLLNDPVLGPLYKKQQDGLARIEAAETRLKQHEDYVLRERYVGQLGELSKRYNAKFNKDGKGKAFDQQAFLGYALQNQVQNLEVAYGDYTKQDEIDAAVAEAEARGVERGRATQVPHVPFGRRRAPVKPEGLPATIQEVTEDQIAADPEIQEAMQKDLSG